MDYTTIIFIIIFVLIIALINAVDNRIEKLTNHIRFMRWQINMLIKDDEIKDLYKKSDAIQHTFRWHINPGDYVVIHCPATSDELSKNVYLIKAYFVSYRGSNECEYCLTPLSFLDNISGVSYENYNKVFRCKYTMIEPEFRWRRLQIYIDPKTE